MRQAGLSDLHHAARALLSVPHNARAGFCAELLWQAHVADKYVKRLRRLHPQWGDGSLRAAALPYSSVVEVPPHTAVLWPCMAVVLDALTTRSGSGIKA